MQNHTPYHLYVHVYIRTWEVYRYSLGTFTQREPENRVVEPGEFSWE